MLSSVVTDSDCLHLIGSSVSTNQTHVLAIVKPPGGNRFATGQRSTNVAFSPVEQLSASLVSITRLPFLCKYIALV
jgi:hypothetical protein